MSKKIKVGVMGAFRGKCMIGVLLNHPDAELVAVCDKYEPLLEDVKKEAEKVGANVATYVSFDDFIKHDIDAVVLANYANEHAIFAIKCLEAGKHVLSEVLPCGTVAEGVALIEAVEKSGLVYAYAENYCYMQHSFEMWHRIKNGEIGEVNYAEGEYVHDCTSIWPSITYGEPNHWRNEMSSSFYCTHSIGPMLMTLGKRPVSVVGFELPNFCRGGKVPSNRSAASVLMLTLENGAVCRSLHGYLRREGARNINYLYYGDFGMMESGRFEDSPLVNVYKEGDKFCKGSWERFEPKPRIDVSVDAAAMGHMGSDYYSTHFFIEKILGRPEGIEWSIDVYQAVEMGICGLLGYRSIRNGSAPVKIPNFRNKEERDEYRNDKETTFTTTPDGVLIPSRYLEPARDVDEQYFEYMKQLWKEGKNFEEYPF